MAEEVLSYNEKPDINIVRKHYDELRLTTSHRRSSFQSEELSDRKHFLQPVHSKLASCSCSWRGFSQFFFRLAPILQWLPKYSVRNDLLTDITGGVTVGIMHIPQGLAFAMLATLPPVTGLYTALIPVLLYMIMGTSRHLSVGSFAVICLMVAQVCEREAGTLVLEPSPTPENGSSSSPPPDTTNGLWTPVDARKLEIAVSLSMLVGIIQILMGAVRLGVVATFLSDPLISGFTTGSAVLVVLSQLKHIFGLKIPQISRPFAAPKITIYMSKHIASSNIGAIITGVLSLVVLIGLKQVNERFKGKLKVPIPAELLVVIGGTAISYGAAINENFAVPILGKIPKGLPPLSLPNFSVMTKIFPDAFVIAVVIFATNISVAKMIGKKRGYSVDPNQELIAYGAGNVAGSFLSCFPICNALARTMVQENLANTQLCSIVVVTLILMVLLFLAPLFFHLPKAILAAVVIANLIGLLKQFSRLRVLWKIHKSDAVVWFLTCFGVILMGVDVGLGIGVICALFAVVITLSRSSYSILGRVEETELYRDIKHYRLAFEVPGIKVVRFESTLYFGNVERFRNMLVDITGQDPSIQQEPPKEGKVDTKGGDSSGNAKLIDNEVNEGYSNYGAVVSNRKPMAAKNINGKAEALTVEEPNESVHTVVIDGSSFTFIDSMGLHALPSLINEFHKVGVHIYLAGCSSNITRRLVSPSETTATNTIESTVMFPSIHDAVISAVLSRDLEN